MKLNATIVLLIFLFVLPSCAKDKEDPAINVIKPAAQTNFTKGSSFDVEVEFGDDRGLKNFAFMIADKDGYVISDFTHSDQGQLADKSSTWTTSVAIPAVLNSSEFYIHFSVTDQVGKTASAKVQLSAQ